MAPSHSRRRFLQAVGTGTVVGLAGCTGGPLEASGADETTTDDPDSTDTTTDTDTTTTEPTMSTVFHLTSGAEAEQKHALKNVANLLDDDTVDTETVALVANAQGVTAFIQSTPVREQVTSLLDRGVEIQICENSMAAFELSEGDFLDGMNYVPSGVGELTRLQAAKGYAYIRVP